MRCVTCQLNSDYFSTADRDTAIIPNEGVIYWHLSTPTRDVDVETQKEILQEAFEYWGEVLAPIRFEETSNPKIAPIRVHFKRNGHRGLPERFERQVLAYAFFPAQESLGLEGDIYFNDVYKWERMHTSRHTNLLRVAIHEIGHSLGIDHSDVKTDIMYATYNPYNKLRITQDSIDAAIHLYGRFIEELLEHVQKKLDEEKTPSEACACACACKESLEQPKQTFQKNAKSEIAYPVRDATKIKGVASPRVGKSHGLERPTYPGEDFFQEELNEITRLQLEARAGRWSRWFYQKYNLPAEPTEILEAAGVVYGEPETAADVVEMDKPIELFNFILDYLDNNKVPLKDEPKGTTNFLERAVRTTKEVADIIDVDLEKAFEAKYYFGRPRPEEVLNCPPDVATFYIPGSPGHPSYPAGHGTFCGSIYKYVKSKFKLSRSQLKIVRITTQQLAMYRSIAGVHYANDNIVGWELGAGEKWLRR